MDLNILHFECSPNYLPNHNITNIYKATLSMNYVSPSKKNKTRTV